LLEPVARDEYVEPGEELEREPSVLDGYALVPCFPVYGFIFPIVLQLLPKLLSGAVR
jgi:hypothetical protein